jgi:hypothetical protein
VGFFNRQDYFNAHEVWEDWWQTCESSHRRFVQGLIQVAVALYHASRDNWLGARRLYHSAQTYQQPYTPFYCGLDLADWWQQVRACLTEVLDLTNPTPRFPAAAWPTIRLTPAPPDWPDPHRVLHELLSAEEMDPAHE